MPGLLDGSLLISQLTGLSAENHRQRDYTESALRLKGAVTSERRHLVSAATDLQRALAEAEAELELHRKAQVAAQARIDQLIQHLTMLDDLDRRREVGAVPLSEPGTATARAAAERPLSIWCLGTFRVMCHGNSIDDWPSLRGQGILKYLAAHAGTSVSRDTLIEAFWPDADGDAGRRNLHQAIYSLRQTLRREHTECSPILYESGRYRLNPAVDVWIDVEEFDHCVRTARRCVARGLGQEAALQFSLALELYEGDLLAGDYSADWIGPRREPLRSQFRESANWLAKYFFDRGEHDPAKSICLRMLELDACDEAAHYALMLCYSKQGQRSEAIRQYHVCKHTLRQELGVSPSAKTAALLTCLTNEQGLDEASELELSEF